MCLHKASTSITSDTVKFLTNAHKKFLLRTPALVKSQQFRAILLYKLCSTVENVLLTSRDSTSDLEMYCRKTSPLRDI